MTFNPTYTYKPEGISYPRLDNDHQEPPWGKSSTLPGKLSQPPSLVQGDLTDISVGAYGMSNDKPNLKTGTYETKIPEYPTAKENRNRWKKNWRFIIPICLVVGVVIGVVIFAAIFFTKSSYLGNDMLMELHGRMVLLEDWSPTLNDSTSADYRETVSRIEQELESSLKNDKLSLSYEAVKVINLRSGSIIVDFIIVITLPSDAKTEENGDVMVTVEGADAKQKVTAVIKDSIKNTANLNIDTDSVSITVSVTHNPSPSSTTAGPPNGKITKAPSVTAHSTTGHGHPTPETTKNTRPPIRPTDSSSMSSLSSLTTKSSGDVDGRSPNCTFEDGDCGYSIVRPVHEGGSQWVWYGTEGNSSDTALPNADHTTNAEGGYSNSTK
ncbi:uncharacterized protein LOC135463350 [Liolophura sinensis]|uniref:uncharacterized protein LOC135463350 n=1 Tax=Liolophura sinensis TaxID=3198878 RepID=UPI003158B463